MTTIFKNNFIVYIMNVEAMFFVQLLLLQK